MPNENLEIVKLIVSILGFAGTILALYFGFRQYQRAEKWKRAEFVAKEIKEFEADPMVLNAMQMIDWGQRRINLFLKEDLEYDKYTAVNREIQWRALLPHSLKKYYPSASLSQAAPHQKQFTPEEARIRDTYDVFLNYLQRFGNFIEAKLVSPEELKPYLIYWLTAIANGDVAEDSSWRCVLICYINFYGYTGVVSLFKAYGMDISPQGEILASMKEKNIDAGLYRNVMTICQYLALKDKQSVLKMGRDRYTCKIG